MRKGIFQPNSKLLNIIFFQPFALDNLFLENSYFKIAKIDDSVLSVKQPKKRWTVLIGLLICGFFFIVFGFAFLLLLHKTDDFVILFCQAALGLACIAALGYAIYILIAGIKNKYPYECEFNRINGTVTFPTWNMKGEVKVVPFSDCESELHYATVSNYGAGRPDIKRKELKHIDILYKNDLIVSFTSNRRIRGYKDYDEMLTDILKHFSFLVWYMDKNRPLPPGEILNPYRQKDYNRRKLERFPMPLYLSNVKMLDFDEDDRFNRFRDFTLYDKYIQELYYENNRQ